MRNPGGLSAMVLALLCAATAVFGATYTVTNKGDTVSGGTLRWAINAANKNAGWDRIEFNIATPYVIQPTGELPSVEGQTTIDGCTLPAYSGTPLVCLDGQTNITHGLWLTGSNNMVRGLVVSGFTDAGILLEGVRHRVEACYVMSNSEDGIEIYSSAGNWIGGTNWANRNVISGNGGHGVYVRGQNTTNNQIFGNYIGTDPTGMRAQSNTYSGIYFFDCTNNTVGGTNAWQRNLISGNYNGVEVYYTAGGITICGNLIGTDWTGTNRLPNANLGVAIGGSSNTVGGDGVGTRNVISGNGTIGVSLWGSNALWNVVSGNYIGVDTSGAQRCPNLGHGVQIGYFAAHNTIGGTNEGAGNVISGNAENGVTIVQGSHHNVVLGNLIGLNSSGTAAVSNGTYGIRIQSASNTVGGLVAGARNTVSGNGAIGIWIDGTNAVRNKVYGNHVGTDVTGSNIVGNGSTGIAVSHSPLTEIGCAGGGGNVVSGSTGNYGIWVSGAGATGTVIRCNFVGTDASGRLALPNGTGLGIACPGLVVGGEPAYRNIVSGNAAVGISVEASGVVVRANFIGTDVSGLSVLSNGTYGIIVWQVAGCQIGGTNAGDGNVISGSGTAGVRVYGSNAVNNVVAGNYIGTEVNGEQARGNAIGVMLEGAQSNRIGGRGWASANLISGNTSYGVHILSGARANLVQGNYIGTDASVGHALGNGDAGIRVDDSPGNWIGGRTNEGNVIGGNGASGVEIFGVASTSNCLYGNWIGCAVDFSPIGNTEHGVIISQNASSNVIGGLEAGTVTNRIAFNSNDGIRVANDCTGNFIVRNQILSNGWLGIDLGGDSVTHNDAGDGDGGANNLQNFPVLLSATNNGTQITVVASIDGFPTSVKLIEYFSNTDINGSGYGEGEFVMSSTNWVAIGPSGSTVFTNRFPTPARPPNFITAIASDGVTRDSSEFSFRILLDSDNDGMGDGFEHDHFGGFTNGQAYADADGDGSSNLEEFMSATDPHDPLSYLHFTRIATVSNRVAVSLQMSRSRVYNIQRNTENMATGEWTTVVIRMGASMATWTDSVSYAQGFYRAIPMLP